MLALPTFTHGTPASFWMKSKAAATPAIGIRKPSSKPAARANLNRGRKPPHPSNIMETIQIYSRAPKAGNQEIRSAIIKLMPWPNQTTGKPLYGFFSSQGSCPISVGTRSSMIRRARLWVHRHPLLDGFKIA